MYCSKIYQKRNHYNSIFSPDSAIRFASSENKYAGSTSTVYGSNHRGHSARLVASILHWDVPDVGWDYNILY